VRVDAYEERGSGFGLSGLGKSVTRVQYPSPEACDASNS
jgi:hypothetical protein